MKASRQRDEASFAPTRNIEKRKLVNRFLLKEKETEIISFPWLKITKRTLHQDSAFEPSSKAK
jgi:hypothetical protein